MRRIYGHTRSDHHVSMLKSARLDPISPDHPHPIRYIVAQTISPSCYMLSYEDLLHTSGMCLSRCQAIRACQVFHHYAPLVFPSSDAVKAFMTWVDKLIAYGGSSYGSCIKIVESIIDSWGASLKEPFTMPHGTTEIWNRILQQNCLMVG